MRVCDAINFRTNRRRRRAPAKYGNGRNKVKRQRAPSAGAAVNCVEGLRIRFRETLDINIIVMVSPCVGTLRSRRHAARVLPFSCRSSPYAGSLVMITHARPRECRRHRARERCSQCPRPPRVALNHSSFAVATTTQQPNTADVRPRRRTIRRENLSRGAQVPSATARTVLDISEAGGGGTVDAPCSYLPVAATLH
jgi:hypothetical protein